MRVDYHVDTASELNDAVNWYNERRAGLGEAFRAEIYAAVDRILANPSGFAITDGDIRRCFVHRFPYSILFRKIGDEAVRILVIRHHRLRWVYGKGRR